MVESFYYERCPKYLTGDCCGRIHDHVRKQMERRKILLRYLDGRPDKEIFCFMMREPRYEWPGSWQTIKLESAEITEAILEFDRLTNESEEAVKEIHPGLINTSLYDNCPLRKNL